MTIDPPLIDMSNLLPGQQMQIDLTYTNHGLISAFDLQLYYGNHPEIRIRPLVEYIGELPAKSSLTIPVLIERQAAATGPEGEEAGVMCNILIRTIYAWICVDRKWKEVEIAAILPRDYPCPRYLGWGEGGGGGGGSNTADARVKPLSLTRQMKQGCDPCLNEAIEIALCIPGIIPGGNCLTSAAISCALAQAENLLAGSYNHTVGDCIQGGLIGCTLEEIPVVGDIYCFLSTACSFALCLDENWETELLSEFGTAFCKLINFQNPFSEAPSEAGAALPEDAHPLTVLATDIGGSEPLAAAVGRVSFTAGNVERCLARCYARNSPPRRGHHRRRTWPILLKPA